MPMSVAISATAVSNQTNPSDHPEISSVRDRDQCEADRGRDGCDDERLAAADREADHEPEHRQENHRVAIVFARATRCEP
jgi:hypothetical protein